MEVNQTREYMKLANESVAAQRKANQEVIDSQLDAADRMLLRKAADVSLNLAELSAADPT